MASSIPNFDAVLGNENVFLSLTPGQDKQSRIIKFQFPPKITSDNKGGEWFEKSFTGPEPFAIFMGGKARTISMEWTYIVTNEKSGGETWSIGVISDYVKTLRGYFYKWIQAKDSVVKFYAYDVAGSASRGTHWSFRIDDVNISHSSTIIRSAPNDAVPGGLGLPSAGQRRAAPGRTGDRTYPLKTDIKLTLKFFTDGGAGQGTEQWDAAIAQGAITDEGAPVAVDGIKSTPTDIVWF
jgi:hypothetical protein